MQVNMNVYKITNTQNGKIYIGQSIYQNDDYFGSGTLIRRAVVKHGKQNFLKEILECVSTQELLSEREKFWIKYYNSTDKTIGYNITPGGEFGDTITYHPDRELICEKMSISAKKRSIGPRNNFYGKTHSDKTKQLIGVKNKEHAEIRSITMTPEEKKEKFGQPGEKNPMYGKTHSDEARNKISEAFRKSIENNTRKKPLSRFDKMTDEDYKLVRKMYEEDLLGPKRIGDSTGFGYGVVKKMLAKMNITERSYVMSGNKNPMFGKTHSIESRNKISEARCKK